MLHAFRNNDEEGKEAALVTVVCTIRLLQDAGLPCLAVRSFTGASWMG